jgi:hypothetical protein
MFFWIETIPGVLDGDALSASVCSLPDDEASTERKAFNTSKQTAARCE